MSGLNFFTDSKNDVLQDLGLGQGSPATAAASAEPRASPRAAPSEDDGASSGNKTLYLGNLHPFVTEAMLHDLFGRCKGVQELKIIKDKATGIPAGYGFAKFTDMPSAQAALEAVGKPVLFGQELRCNWAIQKELREQLATHTHVFVGDLAPDVTDATLLAAFERWPGCSDARVMWDHASGRSRGYGFVSFTSRKDAEAALEGQNGQPIAGRRVRCGWAQHKLDAAAPVRGVAELDSADPTNTNVYVGNLDPSVNDVEIRRAFGVFGALAEVKLHRKGAFGFVRYRAHADAVQAILGMNGKMLGSKVVKCSWGRHPSLPPSGLHNHLLLASGMGLAHMLQLAGGGTGGGALPTGGAIPAASLGMPPRLLTVPGLAGQPMGIGGMAPLGLPGVPAVAAPARSAPRHHPYAPATLGQVSGEVHTQAQTVTSAVPVALAGSQAAMLGASLGVGAGDAGMVHMMPGQGAGWDRSLVTNPPLFFH